MATAKQDATNQGYLTMKQEITPDVQWNLLLQRLIEVNGKEELKDNVAYVGEENGVNFLVGVGCKVVLESTKSANMEYLG